MPGHVELYHPLLDRTVVVDAGAVSHHAASGWQARGPAFPLPVKVRRVNPPPARLVRIYNPRLGMGHEVPPAAMPHLRRGGWVLQAEWDADQAAAAKAAEAAEARAVPVAAAPRAVVPAGQNTQEK